MEGLECPRLVVEGDWSPAHTKTVKNKLQLYFQSKKKSGGGDCQVEVDEAAPRAAVRFRSEEVMERVLARQDHEIIVENQTVKLRLVSAASPTNSDGVSDSSADSKCQKSKAEPGHEAAAADTDDSECVQSRAVVLENIQDDMSRDLLLMLVENISGLDESGYSLETIWEANRAVVTFNKPTDAHKFLTASQTNQKMKKYGLTTRLLEAATSIRVENLPPIAVKDFLELYFEKSWALPDKIVMIPEEQAAIIMFRDPRVVKSICLKEDHAMMSIPVTVFPYHESLGTALYGKERPAWNVPKPFTEHLHHAVRKFLLMKKLLRSINDQMRPYFCSVDLETPEVKLSPLPGLMRQKGLTAKQVDDWMGTAQQAFRQQMSLFTAFECPASAPAWKAAEKEVHSVVREHAVVVFDTSRGAVTVAGRADDIKQLRAPVENIVLRAMNQIERQTNSISEVVNLSPAMFYILKQDGLQKAVSDVSSEMNLTYSEGTNSLTLTGLPAEVFEVKAWIMEHLSKKLLNLSPGLVDFLKNVDPMDMSQDLFTSQGISAVYSIESKGLLLLGSSNSILADAERKMMMVLSVCTVDLKDQEVLRLPNWAALRQQLLDTYNSSKKKTVDIQIHPERRDKVTVAGFMNPVREVNRALKEFIDNYSRVQEALRVESSAVVQFIFKKKSEDWNSIAKANRVMVQFYPKRPRISITGARLHVQKARSCFQELIRTLFTDTFTVDKPGAKKYFMSQGSLFLSTIMTEFSCVVVLRPENEEEEEDESYEDINGLCYCRVQTTCGVLVSVTKADICGFSTDAVVNAANEDLQHIAGLALALLNAAGPRLQQLSNDYIASRGRLRPGDAIVTDACNLPCKYVVHAVGPRFSDSDKRTAVSHLKLAVRESLNQAVKANCCTVALPAISSGVFGFPIDLCAQTIAQAVREYCDSSQGLGSLTEIHLVDNNDQTVRVLASAVNQEFTDLGPTMTVPPPAGGRGAAASRRNQRGRDQSRSPRGRGGGGRGAAAGGGAGKKAGGFRGGPQGNRGGQSPRGHTRPGGAAGCRPGRIEQVTAEGLRIVLCKGNIEDQTTDVIVNTIGEDMDLNVGAVSKAIRGMAGPNLQPAVQSAASAAKLQYGNVIITEGFNLSCRSVFHTVCPCWDRGDGRAEQELMSIIRCCLEQAEKLRMASLSFPAIGTGNLGFPGDLVSKVLLREIHAHSRRRSSGHLKEVVVVVHPSNSQSVDCFSREFQGQTGQSNVRREAEDLKESAVWQMPSQSQQSSASVGPVLSPSLGVYQMQMGPLTLEVSSGDITKETSDVIVNSSNHDFTLKLGVSKAILDSAGLVVEQECARIVNSPNYQPRPMILTSAGRLSSRNIIHVVGQKDPATIKDMVSSVLSVCEENKCSSVSFPALGTGQGGANPAAVADAMVGAVMSFVRKKQPRFVRSVKILIFQPAMIAEFHRSMKSRQGEEVVQKSVFTKIKDSVTSFFTGHEEQLNADASLLEQQEFESTVFQLCADNQKAVSQAKKRITDLIVAEQAKRTITDLIVAEQAKRTITDPYISQLSQDDMEQLQALQRELTVSICLDKGLGAQEPSIQLEGLTRDVFTAESTVRDIIRRVERAENLRSRALLVSGLVEWQFQDLNGLPVPFDMYTNLQLEEALERKQVVKVKINNEMYNAKVMQRKAVSEVSSKRVELLRKELKDDAALPWNWEDMKGDMVKLFLLTGGSKEYTDVEAQLTKTGLTANIISIERVQNTTLWQSYQLMKKQLEAKNKHTNNEKVLFHGTDANSIDLINNTGFNRSYAGKHGAMFGNGTYFAVDPAYSAQGYAKPSARGHKRMYLARVLVGDFTKGSPGLVAPPARSSGNAADLYDSVTNNPATPAMFVIFNDIQAYPEYLITFI